MDMYLENENHNETDIDAEAKRLEKMIWDSLSDAGKNGIDGIEVGKLGDEYVVNFMSINEDGLKLVRFNGYSNLYIDNLILKFRMPWDLLDAIADAGFTEAEDSEDGKYVEHFCFQTPFELASENEEKGETATELFCKTVDFIIKVGDTGLFPYVILFGKAVRHMKSVLSRICNENPMESENDIMERFVNEVGDGEWYLEDDEVDDDIEANWWLTFIPADEIKECCKYFFSAFWPFIKKRVFVDEVLMQDMQNDPELLSLVLGHLYSFATGNYGFIHDKVQKENDEFWEKQKEFVTGLYVSQEDRLPLYITYDLEGKSICGKNTVYIYDYDRYSHSSKNIGLHRLGINYRNLGSCF